MELFGWLSAFCLGLCAAPQTLKSVRTGRADDLAWGFLIIWIIGEVFGFLYVLPKVFGFFYLIPDGPSPILANYILNIALLIPIIVVKLKGCRG